MMDQHHRLPGWTFCKFGLRGPGADERIEVTGIVRDGFGAYWCRFMVSQGEGAVEQNVAVGVHVHSGYAFGVFATLGVAIEVAEIAIRMSRCGEFYANGTDDNASMGAFRELSEALHAAGYCEHHMYCRPIADGVVVPGHPIPVWMRHDTDDAAPKGVKLS